MDKNKIPIKKSGTHWLNLLPVLVECKSCHIVFRSDFQIVLITIWSKVVFVVSVVFSKNNVTFALLT